MHGGALECISLARIQDSFTPNLDLFRHETSLGLFAEKPHTVYYGRSARWVLLCRITGLINLARDVSLFITLVSSHSMAQTTSDLHQLMNNQLGFTTSPTSSTPRELHKPCSEKVSKEPQEVSFFTHWELGGSADKPLAESNWFYWGRGSPFIPSHPGGQDP